MCISGGAARGEESATAGAASGGAYFDVAYLGSGNQPANGEWRTKSTSTSLDELTLNNLTVFASQSATQATRWGWQLGLQAGRDIDNLVTDEAADGAETLKHLYYTSASYLLPWGHGLVLTGGVIPGNIGYEGFWAIDNPNYTRGYYADLVPFFHFGLQASYPYNQPFTTSLYVINGYDYLASPNDVPSYALQLNWAPQSLSLTGNLYYGPEQTETATEYWRSVYEGIAEWSVGRFVLAADAGYGREKQAAVLGNPVYHWGWVAAWLQWQPTVHWHAALRPLVYNDDDGAMTGHRQRLTAITATVEYRAMPVMQSILSARLEYRYDHSTGPEGGFHAGAANQLQPHQHLLIAALLLQLDNGR